MKGCRKVGTENRYGSGGLWYRPDGTPMNHPGGVLENYDPLEALMENAKDVQSPQARKALEELEDHEDFGTWS